MPVSSNYLDIFEILHLITYKALILSTVEILEIKLNCTFQTNMNASFRIPIL